MLFLYHVSDLITNEEIYNGLGRIGEECLLGTLTMVEHRGLSCIFNHPSCIDLPFFEDTRWQYSQVKLVLKACKECQANLINKGNLGNTVYKKMGDMLEEAVEKQHGILFLCD